MVRKHPGPTVPVIQSSILFEIPVCLVAYTRFTFMTKLWFSGHLTIFEGGHTSTFKLSFI